MPTPPKITDQFSSLVAVVEALRGPDGCPWDKEQSHRTLTQYAIEEAHELAEAIDNGKTPEIVEELGDLLLQVVLHAEIAKQEGNFTLPDVIRSITEKMIRRHPHVFSDEKVKDSADVLERWGELKAKEKPKNESPFSSIPKALPALLRAQKIGAKTKKFNFDWSRPEEVIAKIEEELGELKDAVKSKDPNEIQHEIGDLLFSVAQLARHLEQDSEQCLRTTNNRFESRFLRMRELAAADGRDFETLPTSELEKYWDRVKLEGKC